jgi:transposase-like protein
MRSCAITGKLRCTHDNGDGAGRSWATAAEKLQVIEESLSSGLSVVEFARQRDLHPNLVHSWRRQAKTGKLSPPDSEARFAPVAVAGPGNVAVMSEYGAGCDTHEYSRQE